MAESDPLEPPAEVEEARVDELYGLPLDEFVARRDALAAELRKGGRRAEAGWVKGLRRPSAAAWVVNQLARTRRRDAAGILEAGERLRAAHERALSGRASAGDLRAAAQREGEAVRALLEAAPGLLDRDGYSPSPPTLDRVEQTLHAVALDERARAEFAAGRLARERRAAGLGLFAAPAPAEVGGGEAEAGSAKPRGGGKARSSESPTTAEVRARAREGLREAKTQERERRRAVKAAERAAEAARREAETAERTAEAARREAETAERAAEAAQREAQAARERLDAATDAADDARAAAEQARARVAAAQDEVDRAP